MTVYTGTIISATINTIRLTNDASDVDNFYNNFTVHILTQSRRVINYVGATRTLTVYPDLSVIPTFGDTIEIKDIPIPSFIWAGGIQSGQTFPNFYLHQQVLPSTFIDSGVAGENLFGYPNVAKISNIPLISSIVETQFPSFVREDHERFIAFIEAYYEWLEQYRNVMFDISRLKSYQDIDESIDVFVDHFFREFLVNIPRNIVADKALVLKHIREFYRAKGTEKSYKFFFRILFNTNTEFYYPRVDILRVSDGKWIQHKTLRVKKVRGNPFDLLARKIRGINTNTTAFVEKVQMVQENYLTVYELYLNRSSITGSFEPEETIVSDEIDVVCETHALPVKINIVSPGSGYKVGMPVTIIGPGVNAKAEISSVSDIGEVLSVKITNYGAGYSASVGPTYVIFPTEEPVINLASGTVTLGALTNYPGYFLNEDGQLSTTKYLHDGNYYQQFSYVVYVNESVNRYRDALKKLIHPAGLKFFGGVRSQELLPAIIKIPSSKDSAAAGFPGYGNIIVNRLLKEFPYRPTKHPEWGWNEAIDARLKAHPIDFKRISWFKEAPQSYKLGPSYRSLQRDKFTYKPFELRDLNLEMKGGNSEYWGPKDNLNEQKANAQIKDFGNLTTKDIHEKPWTKINIMPDPCLRNKDPGE